MAKDKKKKGLGKTQTVIVIPDKKTKNTQRFVAVKSSMEETGKSMSYVTLGTLLGKKISKAKALEVTIKPLKEAPDFEDDEDEDDDDD